VALHGSPSRVVAGGPRVVAPARARSARGPCCRSPTGRGIIPPAASPRYPSPAPLPAARCGRDVAAWGHAVRGSPDRHGPPHRVA
jgi:hypothetical protein